MTTIKSDLKKAVLEKDKCFMELFMSDDMKENGDPEITQAVCSIRDAVVEFRLSSIDASKVKSQNDFDIVVNIISKYTGDCMIAIMDIS